MFTIVALHFQGPQNDQRSEFVWRMKHSAYFRLTRTEFPSTAVGYCHLPSKSPLNTYKTFLFLSFSSLCSHLTIHGYESHGSQITLLSLTASFTAHWCANSERNPWRQNFKQWVNCKITLGASISINTNHMACCEIYFYLCTSYPIIGYIPILV